MSLRLRFFLSAMLLVLAGVVPLGIYGFRFIDESMELWHDAEVRAALELSLQNEKEPHLRKDLTNALIRYNQLGALRRPLEREALVMGLSLIALVLLLSAAMSWLLAYQLTRPVRSLASAAKRIAMGDLSLQVPPTNVREMSELVDAFNEMTHGLREYRAALSAAERRAAWQDIARAIAHEIKNPLTPMRLTTQRLQERFQDNRERFEETFLRSSEMILAEIDRLERLANAFSSFARMPAASLSPMDLRDVGEKLTGLYQTEYEAGNLVVVVPEQEVPINGDEEQLLQAAVNLVKNALEATREAAAGADTAGNVTVSVRILEDGARAVLSVEDSGPGIPPDVAGTLFRPYVSTKPDGSGIGLAVVERVVADHGGSAAASNRDSGGARFEIVLPLLGKEDEQRRYRQE